MRNLNVRELRSNAVGALVTVSRLAKNSFIYQENVFVYEEIGALDATKFRVTWYFPSSFDEAMEIFSRYKLVIH